LTTIYEKSVEWLPCRSFFDSRAGNGRMPARRYAGRRGKNGPPSIIKDKKKKPQETSRRILPKLRK